MNDRSLEARWRPLVLLFFSLALLFSFWTLSVGFSNDIMDEHSFRQTQTAYAAFWLLKGGPFFAYETPMFGHPWSAPFEFPLYQWLVAKFSLLSGIPLEGAGRLVGRAFFYLALWPIYSLFRSLRFPEIARWAGLTLYLLSPLYLYWSRTFMIESTALFFGLAYSALFARALRTGRALDWGLVAAAGALAGAAKITTAFAFYLLNAVFWFAEWKTDLLLPARWKRRESWLLLLLGFLLPGVLSLIWVKYSDAMKLENPLAEFSTSVGLREWNFGTWSQRVSGSTWYMFFRKTLRDALGHRAAWILSVLFFPFLPKRERLLYALASVFFVIPPMVFTNLHIAHNYYWYANAIFILAALAVALSGLWRRAEEKPFLAWVFVGFLGLTCIYELRTYMEFPYHWQKIVNEGPKVLGARVQALSKPEDVIWVSGAGWYPAMVYYTQRRSIMDPKSYGPADPRIQGALERTERAGYHVALYMLCLDGQGQASLLEQAKSVAELDAENIGKGTLCDIYRVRGLKRRPL